VDIHVKISAISICSPFMVFNHDFIIYIDFICIASSNIASDDVTT